LIHSSATMLPFVCLVLLAMVNAQTTSSGDAAVTSLLSSLSLSLPVFNLNFSLDPTAAVGGALNWKWAASDVTDSPTLQSYHAGVAILNASVSSYIDLSAAAGPNSGAVVLPAIVGGAGSGAVGSTGGWSIEVVFKATAVTTWAKLISLGDGPNTDVWMLGFDGNDYGRFLVEQYNSNTLAPSFTHALCQVQRPLLLNTWYHITVVMTSAVNGSVSVGSSSAGAGSWYIYVNGQLQNWASALASGTPVTLTSMQGANYPQAVSRPLSYLGKSDYSSDANFAGVIDALRIYDYALNSTAIAALASLYVLNISSGVAPPGSTAPGFSASGAEYTAPSNLLGFDPVLNIPFASSPAAIVGGTTAYTWSPYSAGDSASIQALHSGVVTLNASLSSYIDLNAVTGPQSIGQTLPIIFGISSGAGPTYGWSIELVFKPLSATTWAKFIDWGTGANIDSLYFGWQGSSNTWEIGNDNQIRTSEQLAGDSQGQLNVLTAPTLNSWYHVVIVLTPYSSDQSVNNTAMYTVYVNGLSVAIQPLGNMPLPIYRHVSYIGQSDWFDAGTGDANINATYDAIRVWDRALTAQQVNQLSFLLYAIGPRVNATFSTGGAAISTSSSTSTPASSTSLAPSSISVTSLVSAVGTAGSSGGSSSLSGGAIAGIVVGSVAGVALVCVVTMILRSRDNQQTKRKNPAVPHMVGSYGEMEPSRNDNVESDAGDRAGAVEMV
jgi:Concanavalin A-like lectin/glucanases superfamily